jgi:2-polyprenyl-3-methyl-5-hydroxy-6-metoxy-1,4-benzoquinol methylase
MAVSKYDIDEDLVAKPGTSHALMLELIGANKRVLDVGCDTGYLGRVLITMSNTVSGVEVNPVSAEEARQHLTKVLVADLEGADLVGEFGAGSFDVVVFGDVLEHLKDPLQVLRQARPLLAPGGSVVISTPNVAHGDVRLALLGGRFDYSKVGILDDTHLRFFTRDSLVTFLHDAGFVLADLRRSVAPLFTTELGVREDDFDPALVASLRADVEATTYQFVLRAVPDDATSLETTQALQLDELSIDAERLRGEVAALTTELTETRRSLTETRRELEARVAEAQERVNALQGAHDSAVAQRDAAFARIAELRPSFLGLTRRALRQGRDKS